MPLVPKLPIGANTKFTIDPLTNGTILLLNVFSVKVLGYKLKKVPLTNSIPNISNLTAKSSNIGTTSQIILPL